MFPPSALSPDNTDVPTVLLPQMDRFRLDQPGSRDVWYAADRKKFAERGMARRHSIVRVAFDAEFDAEFALLCSPPPLWIQVLRLQGWHYRFPFWRGPQPFVSAPNSNPEIAALVCGCLMRGGYDNQALHNWRANWSMRRRGDRPW